MKKQICIFTCCALILVSVVFLSGCIQKRTLGPSINGNMIQTEIGEKPQSGEFLIYPDSVLMAVGKEDDFTFVRYETYNGGIQNFYKEKLQHLGWVKIADLSKEDMTRCGGDWGGTYEKEGLKFKLHICGPDAEHVLTNIFFYFYNVEPEVVLGTDLSGGIISCVNDAEIEIVNACYTKDTLRILVKTKSLEVNKFQVDITAEKYRDMKDVEVKSDKSGIMEINIKYDAEEYGIIEKVKVTPIISRKGIKGSYYCRSQRIESEVESCD